MTRHTPRRTSHTRAMTTGRDPNLTRVFALCLLGAILLARPALGADEGAPPLKKPDRRASFPLRASPGESPGTVSLVWTPPTARRVLPGDDASDDDDIFVPPGLAAFRAALGDSAAGGRFDIFAGVCVEGDPRVDGFDARLHAYAPPTAPCAPATTRVATIDDDTAAVVDSLTPGATYAFRVVYLPQGTAPDDEENDEKKDTEEGVAEAVKEAWSSAATATATRTDDQSPTPTPPSIDLALEDPELMFCGATAGEFIFSFVRAIRLMMSCFVFRFFPERRDTPGRLRGFNRVGVRVLSGMFQNVGMQRVGALRERRRTVHRRGRQRAVLADERTGIRSIRPG